MKVARVLVILTLLSCGCGSYFKDLGQNVTTGAISAISTDDSKKKVTGLVGSARDEVLGPTTQKEVKALVEGLDPSLQKLVQDTGTTLRDQVALLV